jgi:hypothetical protein
MRAQNHRISPAFVLHAKDLAAAVEALREAPAAKSKT